MPSNSSPSSAAHGRPPAPLRPVPLAERLRGISDRSFTLGVGTSSSDPNHSRVLGTGPPRIDGDGLPRGSSSSSFGSGAGVSAGGREGAAAAPAAAATGSRAVREVARPPLVQDSDSDDDIVFTGQSVGGVRTGSASPGRVNSRAGSASHSRDINQVSREASASGSNPVALLNRMMAHRAANRPDAPRQRPNISPASSPDPAPAPRPRIGFGGAVLQSGNRRHSYLPAPAASAPQPPAPLPNPPDNVFLVQRRPPHSNWYNTLLARRDQLEQMERLLEFSHDAMGYGVVFGEPGPGAGIGVGVGGPAGRREEDVEAILKTVETPKYHDPAPGFTRNFDVADAQTAASPIVINDDGEVVRSRARGQKRKRPHLACAQCDDQLLVSEAYRSSADRVWALRCGHVVDHKCLDEVMVPKTPGQLASVDRHPEVLDEPRKIGRGAARKARKVKVQEPKPDEYRWVCPVSGCGERHVSWDIGGTWVNKEGEGAIAVYA